MRSVTAYAIAGITFGLLGSSAVAADDPIEGQAIAEEHCSSCHDVAAGGGFKEYPPSFAAMAVYRSEAQIRAMIMYPALHTAMPDVPLYLLVKDKLDGLVTYILSLEETAKR